MLNYCFISYVTNYYVIIKSWCIIYPKWNTENFCSTMKHALKLSFHLMHLCFNCVTYEFLIIRKPLKKSQTYDFPQEGDLCSKKDEDTMNM